MADLEDVYVLDLHGDGFLDHHGIGHATIDKDGQITEIRCGIFAVNKPIPKNGTEYVISGDIIGPPKRPFKVTLTCTNAGRPSSTFR